MDTNMIYFKTTKNVFMKKNAKRKTTYAWSRMNNKWICVYAGKLPKNAKRISKYQAFELIL